MRRKRFTMAAVALALLLTGPDALLGQEPQRAPDPVFQSPESLLTALYTAASAEPGAVQDWDYLRSFFLEEAVFVMRTTRTATSIFDLDGFIDDFKQFMAQPGPRQAGFQERLVRTHPFMYRDMAHVLVLYEAHIPGSSRPPQQGVDSFLLVKRDGRWWISANANEVVDAQHPVPPELGG